MATEHINNGNKMNITKTTKTPATITVTNALCGLPVGSSFPGFIVETVWEGVSLTGTAPRFVETSYEIDGMNYAGSDMVAV
jgi:hypothetical protein